MKFTTLKVLNKLNTGLLFTKLAIQEWRSTQYNQWDIGLEQIRVLFQVTGNDILGLAAMGVRGDRFSMSKGQETYGCRKGWAGMSSLISLIQQVWMCGTAKGMSCSKWLVCVLSLNSIS